MVDIFAQINEYREKGLDLVLVTVTEKEGMSPADVGKKMLVTEIGHSFGTVGGGSLEFYAIEKAKKLIKERKSLTEKYILNDKEVFAEEDAVKLNMACGGKVTLFYEYIGPKQYVYIFGAGHCGEALAKILKPLGFYVTLIDNRSEVIEKVEQYANTCNCLDFTRFVDEGGLKENSFVVVCTPSHEHDFDVLDKIIEKNIHLAYFGMLCSKKKIADYLNLVKNKYGDVELKNFYSPIGLNIGGNSPEEIAISISSEILSVYYGKSKINAHLSDPGAVK